LLALALEAHPLNYEALWALLNGENGRFPTPDAALAFLQMHVFSPLKDHPLVVEQLLRERAFDILRMTRNKRVRDAYRGGVIAYFASANSEPAADSARVACARFLVADGIVGADLKAPPQSFFGRVENAFVGDRRLDERETATALFLCLENSLKNPAFVEMFCGHLRAFAKRGSNQKKKVGAFLSALLQAKAPAVNLATVPAQSRAIIERYAGGLTQTSPVSPLRKKAAPVQK